MSAVFDLALHSRRPQNRAFNYAVLASLAFHAAVLFSFTMRPKAPAVQPGPLVAHLAPRASAAPAPAQPEPPRPRVEEAAPPPPPPPQVKPVPQPKPSPLAKAEPKAAKPAPAAPVAPAPAQPQPPAVAAPPAAPSAPAAPSVPGPAAKVEPSPAPPSVDNGSLDTYRIELMRMARNYKRYPRVAMDNNWEGRVVVRMIIGANGMIASITVVSSSGHEILDKQAVDMIQKAKPRVLIPAALRGKEFPLEIPVIYSLREPDAG